MISAANTDRALPGLFALLQSTGVPERRAANHAAAALLKFHLRRAFVGYQPEVAAYEDVAHKWGALHMTTVLTYYQHDIGVAVHDFLAAARSAQYSVLRLMAQFPKPQSLPSSLADFSKKPDAYELDGRLLATVQRYWEQHGRLLKDYRDYGEHYQILTSDCVACRLEEAPVIRCLLPDNPAEKAQAKTTFDREIQVGAYVFSEAIALLFFVREVVKCLVFLTAATPEEAMNWMSTVGFVVAPRESIVISDPSGQKRSKTGLAMPMPDLENELFHGGFYVDTAEPAG